MKYTCILTFIATAVSMVGAITISLPSGVSIPSGISLPSGVTVVSAQASATDAADGAAAGAENNKLKARAKVFGARQNFGGQQGGQTTSTATATATAGINIGGLGGN
ncbi:hypothetical protein QBC37DRAFT_405164 [Rhypophila decipiens]|uniref:Uncharacterized protein n=1 Tax=Rhypophila decipiens TaxID=261697 RepID=A0AAN6Y1T6_9PEZI|nr:hypothetical protein QBC37DRAFT_405164 [Rhypophila decipiens]